jgi:hypothetical protein
MAGTISTRISIDGAEDIRKKLEELGAAGAKAFQQIQDAAKKPIIDPAQIDRSKQAFDQLAVAAQKTGNAIEQAGQQAQAAGESIGTSLVSAARNFTIAATAIAFAISAVVRSLTSGAGETAQTISSQADKLTLTIPQWLKLRASIEAAGGSAEGFIKSVGPLIGALNKLSLEASGKSMQTFADGTSVTIFQMTKMSDETKKLTTELAKFGVTLDMIQKGDVVAIMQKLAQTISAMPDGAAKAAAGVRFFGQNWQQAIKDLTAGKNAIDDSVGAMGQMRIASRQMSADQIKDAKDAADQWDDLAKAIRAIKDQIGALFSGSSFDRAKWLTDIVDDARILLTTFLKLNEAGRADFLANLKDGAAATVFKVLVATGQQLAGAWGVLVAAGEKLMGIFDGIAGVFEGITGSQVAAFFITAAIAAAGLALALKTLSLLLTPLLMLFSPFGAALLAAGAAAVLFWDQITKGAQEAAALIPVELQDIADSFKKLFSGDFSGFWDQFSAAASAAFQKISQGPDTGWVSTLVKILATIPGTIELIVKAFIGLGQAAQSVADAINKVFGTELTGTDIAAIVIIGQMTGAFQLLGIAVGIAGVAINTLIGIFGGVPVGIALIGAAIVGAIAAWLRFSEAGQAAVAWVDGFAQSFITKTNEIGSAIGNLVSKIGELASAIGGAIWDTFANAGIAAINTISNAIDGLIAKFKAIGSAIAGAFSGGGGEPGSVTPAPGFAHGGMIGGRGSGTSDSNLAWVSRGEHIMPARAVRQPGVLAFLEALRRSGGDLSRVLDGIGRFATGGLVTMPALAGGGIGGMSHVTIQFPGLAPIGGLRATQSVVDELQRAAAMAQVRSGGRKPSRYT